MMHCINLVNLAREIINDTGLQVWRSQAQGLLHVQSAYEELAGRFIAIDDGHLLVRHAFTAVAPTSPSTTQYINLPWWIESVKRVVPKNSAGQEFDAAYPLDIAHRDLLASGFQSWRHEGSQLVFDYHGSGSKGAISTIEVLAYRAPALLCAFFPEATTSTTIDFPSEAARSEEDGRPLGRMMIEDDYYNGTRWVVVSGPGQGQVFEIGSFKGQVGTLLTGTSFASDTTLTEDSLIAMVPSIPSRSHRIIPWLAAGEGAAIEENVSASSLIRNKEKTMWDDFQNTMTTRQRQLSQRQFDIGG